MTVLALPEGPLRVVALGAHPDDIEIGCGGALLALAAQGADIRTLILTGTSDREEEARTAARAFGVAADPQFGGLRDARLPAAWDAVKDALHELRDAVPDPHIVFAPRPEDAHQDHALLGKVIASVWRGPLLLHYEIPKWDGDLGRPNVYVPLSTEIAQRKVALLNECFPSQASRGWWDDEFFFSIMRLRGAETQSRYAEAFFSGKITLGV